MKKIFAILLCACVLISIVACQKPEAPDIDTTDTVETDSGTSENDNIELVKNGAPAFSILFDESDYYSVSTDVQILLHQKTGLNFKVYRFETEGDLPYIYVGADASKLDLFEEKLTYGTYGVTYKDGNIYIFGDSASDISSAVQKFFTKIIPSEHVVMGENGKASSAVIPKSAVFTYIPYYTVSSPQLLSASLGDYKVVLPKSVGVIDKRLVEALLIEVATQTGYMLDVVYDTGEGGDREIVIGNANRQASTALYDGLERNEYAIKSEGNSVYLGYTTYLSFHSLAAEFKKLYASDTGNSIDIESSCNDVYEKEEDAIRVMTYNVLYKPVEGFAPNVKKVALADVLLSTLPDFVGLQESADYCDDIADIASEYYEKADLAVVNRAILYRKDKWRPSVDEEGNVISKYVEFPVMWTWGYEWIMLEKTDDPTVKVIVGNLHFCNTDIEAGYRQYRPEQMKMVNDEFKRLEQEYSDIPIFFTGDYNTIVASTGNETYADGWQHVVGETSFKSGLELTTNRDLSDAIDHVVTNPDNVEVICHRKVSYKAIDGVSDHSPQYIDVRLKQAYK